jgi:hypothetical protein
MWVKIQESRVPASIDYRNPGRPAKGAKLNLGHQFRRRNRRVASHRRVLRSFCVMFFLLGYRLDRDDPNLLLVLC